MMGGKCHFISDRSSEFKTNFSNLSTGGDAENARHENARLENAAQTCRLLQGVENARLENVAQKYRGGKCRNGKCGTKPLREKQEKKNMEGRM